MEFQKNELFCMSFQTDLLFTAISNAQAEFPVIRKVDQGHRHKYANINSIIIAITPIMKKYGLSFVQPVSILENGTDIVKTIITHSSGQFILSSAKIIHDPKDIQSYGKGISYTKRYALKSILGIAEEDDTDDDDGNYQKDKGMPKKEKIEMITPEQIETLKDKIKKSKNPKESLDIVEKSTNIPFNDWDRMTQKQLEWVIKKIS